LAFAFAPFILSSIPPPNSGSGGQLKIVGTLLVVSMLGWLAKLRRRIVMKNGQSENVGYFYELPFQQGACFSVLQGYGGSYSHAGDSYFSIDFAMPEKTPICAARGGIVYCVIDHFSDGCMLPSFKPKANAIYVLHNDDTIAAYLHLMHGGAYVDAGEVVSVGQTIGLSGNTGWSGSPHLHFHVSDAYYHRRIPTKFEISRNRADIVEVNKRYIKPLPDNRSSMTTDRVGVANPQRANNAERDAFAFFPELLNLSNGLVSELSAAGYEMTVDYYSIDAIHDVNGLEVCGIHDPQTALDIIRFLLRRFPGWNAGWLHAPDSGSTQEWVARIQRDRGTTMEYWGTD
jgi:murein DD-endopeptidase MepM/ murein hydrolase activator NlpD